MGSENTVPGSRLALEGLKILHVPTDNIILCSDLVQSKLKYTSPGTPLHWWCV